MTNSLRLTVVFEDRGDGWIVASVPEVPGAHSQGRTRQEARENVIDAARGLLELRFEHHAARAVDPGTNKESVDLLIAP